MVLLTAVMRQSEELHTQVSIFLVSHVAQLYGAAVMLTCICRVEKLQCRRADR